MAAGVAHEIRNPLNGIGGFASLLVRDLAGSDDDSRRRRRWAEAVATGVEALNRTVGDLLAFTRPRTPARRATAPGDLAASVLDLVRLPPEAGGSGPAIAIDDRWAGGDIACDPGQIRQVLLNLVQNALHAVEEQEPARNLPGPAVRLGLDQVLDGDGRLSLRFTVDDAGPGIDPAIRPHLFTPFHTTRSQGTGLGLAIAHTLVSLHGGSLTAEDSPLGGARFVLVLPVDPPPVSAAVGR
jgi:signal transduction histidine kinase